MKSILLLLLVFLQTNLFAQDTLNTNCIVSLKDGVKERVYFDYQIIIDSTYAFFDSGDIKTSFKVYLGDTTYVDVGFTNTIYTLSCNIKDSSFKIETKYDLISMVAIKNELTENYLFYLECR